MEAVLDLIRETGTQPSAQAVAERAEVSLRTVFRHFDDVESLFGAAVAHQIKRVGSMFEPLPASGDLATRIDALLTHRALLFEEIAPIRRAAQRRDEHEAIRTWLARSHDLLRVQMVTQLAPELDRLSPAERATVVEALDVATGWPAWDAMRRLRGLDVETATAVVSLAIHRLLEVR